MTALTHVPGQGHPGRTSSPSPFGQLALTSWRELIREPKTLFFSMIFPFIFLAMFSAIGVLVDRGGEAPRVSIAADSSGAVGEQLRTALAAHDVGLAEAATANVTVSVAGDAARVVLGGDGAVSKNAVVAAIRDLGVATSDIQVLTSAGVPVYDPVRGSLPTVLMLGLLSLAFLGTAAPLVGLRGKGTLRLLGTTPVRRATFVLAQTPVRVLLGAVQVALVAGYAHYLGYLDLGATAQLVTTCIIGLVMLLAIGYLFASRMTSQDLATTIASLLIPVAMIFAGSMMPEQLMPEGVRSVTQYLPTTILSKGLGVSLVGEEGIWSMPVTWAVMGGIAAVATVLASALFSWDQGEKR